MVHLCPVETAYQNQGDTSTNYGGVGMIDYTELVPETEEAYPESWLCDSLPAFRVEDEMQDAGDCSPLCFD